ncbi:hypothetical protein HK405_004226, partial [Cladochytrium tenue]
MMRKTYALYTKTTASRNHIERLMARVDKPVQLPASRRPKPLAEAAPATAAPGTAAPVGGGPGGAGSGQRGPKEIVRNIQGSSAGAGSGEFHVYRALRRKEFARLKMMDARTRQ